MQVEIKHRTAQPEPMRKPDHFFSSEAHDAEPPFDALVAFTHAVENARYAAPKIPAWWKTNALRLNEGCCPYCGKDVWDAPALDPIIPIVAGGPLIPDAMVLCCKVCKRSRHRRDLLVWQTHAQSALRALRADMACETWNHVSRDLAQMQTHDKAASVIKSRWARPRFYCHGGIVAEGGFIGWRDHAQVPANIQLRLTFEHRGGRLHRPMAATDGIRLGGVIFWFQTQRLALDALWDVIDRNGLVRRVDLSAPDSMPDGLMAPSHAWHLVLPTIADLVRRRWRKSA